MTNISVRLGSVSNKKQMLKEYLVQIHRAKVEISLNSM